MKTFSEEAKRVAVETIQHFRGNTFDALVDTIELYWKADAELKRLLKQYNVMRGQSPEPPPCSHLPMVDTGVGYLLCEACGYSKKIGGGGA